MAWPTAPIHGKLARVEMGSTVIDYSSRWSINWVKDAAVFGRQGQEYKEASPGQASWTGTAEFLFVRSSDQEVFQNLAISSDATPSLTTGVTSSITFCFDTTANKLAGDVIVTGFSIDAGAGDVIRCTFSFQGSGAINFSA